MEPEAYLEDNRPTLDEICESYEECNKECPEYEFCHPQAESEPQESEDKNENQEHNIFKQE